MVLPKASAFRVALKGTADGDDERTVKCNTEAVFVPFGEDIVDGEESRVFRARGMGVGIAGVTGKDLIIKSSREGAEKAEDGSFDARRVGFGKFMQNGGSARGAVAAMTGATFTTGFDFVLPMRAEYDSLGGGGGKECRTCQGRRTGHIAFVQPCSREAKWGGS